MTLTDGTTIAQTSALCVALGQDLGMAPEGAGASAKAIQISMDITDFMSEIMGKKGAERLMKWMSHFEACLGDKGYFMGESVSYVDFCVLGAMMCIPLKIAKGVDDIKGVSMTPKVQAWFDKMTAMEAVKKVDAISAFL